MNKITLKFMTLVSASFIATSCSLFANLTYNWLDATNNNTEIRYCLLIGQNEHSDSIERTRWTREALGTRDAATEINGNANLGSPKIGELTLGQGTEYEKTFKVTELEHMEQKSLAGVVWDEITANSTTATWINKHGKNMTMLISNNDGMALGAMHAYNYTKGLPLFGYDANEDAMRLVSQCKETEEGLMGTVDQVAAAQTSAAYMIIRNILDDQASGKHNIGTTAYDPTHSGFNEKNPKNGIYIDGFGEGVTHQGIMDPHNDERSPHNLDLSQPDGYHEILSTSEAIDINNIDKFFVDDPDNPGQKKIAGAAELAWHPELGYVHKSKNYKAPNKTYEVFHVYNNSAETYLQGTMKNYYSAYAEEFGIKDEKYDGDGISEQSIFDKTDAYLGKGTFDAFLINMVTTTDGGTFVTHLAKYAANKVGRKDDFESHPKGWDNWEDRLDTPLIFWNKQPQTVRGEVDIDTMNNKFFKYTYFVGVDAAYGGKVQGKMITDYLNQKYLKSVQGQ